MLRFTMSAAVTSALLAVSSAQASDVCHDLWFTRNLVADRAGYCFGSALGKAIFDNTGCIGKSVDVGRAGAALMQRLRGVENALGCKVNTSATKLDVDDLAQRWMMRDLPVADEFESACIGWRLDDVTLRSARSDNAPGTGSIQTGDTILYSHMREDGWDYVTVHDRRNELVAAGWVRITIDERSCEQLAG